MMAKAVLGLEPEARNTVLQSRSPTVQGQAISYLHHHSVSQGQHSWEAARESGARAKI